MSLWLIIGIVFALYIRTLNYKYVIDDYVRREGYMYCVPMMQPQASFWLRRPPVLYRVFMIGMHCVNVSIIYMIWGWAPALLFAVHPIGTIGTAWVTGNYYATAAYFTLIAFYFIHTFGTWWAALIAAPLYLSALYSTVNPIMFPFVFLFGSSPWGLAMFPVLGYFFTTKKWKVGISIRKNICNETHVSSKFHGKRLFLMTKVVGRYTANVLWPHRTGFFDGYGHRIRDSKKIYNTYCSPNMTFWAALALTIVVFIGGLMIHPFGTMWFFTFIVLHSQWNLTGQFFALRYLYLAMVGLCVVVGTLLQPYPLLMTIVATYLVMKTNGFIPAWKDQESLWRNDTTTYPYYAQTYNSYAQHIMAVMSPEPGKDRAGCPPWKINELGGILFKAESMEPDSWEIQMNIAAYLAFIGQLEACLERTDLAIKYLKEAGGMRHPLDMLVKQRENIALMIKQRQGGLPNSRPENKEDRDGQRTEETEGTLEPIGAAGA